MKRDLIKQYNLPPEVKFCKKCTISNQRPRITFDEQGVCSACHYGEYKRTKIDWDFREKELVELCDRHRKNNGEYDVIVPCSGGKDGGFVAHQLKYKYGMNPLAVTWAPLKQPLLAERIWMRLKRRVSIMFWELKILKLRVGSPIFHLEI